MADSLDYYDVQNMIRDARSEIRGEIANAVAALRADVSAIADELREALGEERVERHDAISALREDTSSRIESVMEHLR